MLHLFLDTNIYLALYGFGRKDLDEVGRLSDSVRQKTVRLHLPEQVVHEFERNRDARISRLLEAAERRRLPDGLSPLFRNEESLYRKVQEHQRNWSDATHRLTQSVRQRASSGLLDADSAIKGLFDVATRHSLSDSLLSRARRRVELGNPPGKGGSLGDAVNWESLLEVIPHEESLVMISDDNDYRSSLTSEIHSSLRKEWEQKKKSGVILHRELLDFANEHKNLIVLQMEQERRTREDTQVKNLSESWSFARTHVVIGDLNRCFPFSAENVQRLIEAFLENEQIHWIKDDPDVSAFFEKLLSEQGHQIPSGMAGRLFLLYPRFRRAHDLEDDPVPF